ncbi:HigA family addiction module antitoxin [Rhizobium sp. 32-5/1]|uniref:HigA family addiction module antitoxin n=1 Tax=Rhizobium sp. 32-5/1 TaxID=3019602 RepID=UPI00240E09DD|nr:HigA family addiction module antitoxin [Rhizobium sp. 32-5/1]WEZ83812.1 HigA family addiction module antitoxin [Rhizobium sp. 32-5/1]
MKEHTMFEIHPGTMLKEELEARGMSGNALALALRINSGRVSEILNGKRAVSADTALRLGRFFGNDPQFWLGLQASYDLAVASRQNGERINLEVLPAQSAA